MRGETGRQTALLAFSDCDYPICDSLVNSLGGSCCVFKQARQGKGCKAS